MRLPQGCYPPDGADSAAWNLSPMGRPEVYPTKSAFANTIRVCAVPQFQVTGFGFQVACLATASGEPRAVQPRKGRTKVAHGASRGLASGARNCSSVSVGAPAGATERRFNRPCRGAMGEQKGEPAASATTGLRPVATCQSPLRGYMPSSRAGPEHSQNLVQGFARHRKKGTVPNGGDSPLPETRDT